MRRVCGPRARADWAMLAGEALREAPGRDTDDAAEGPVGLALVVEADRLCRVGDSRAALEQVFRLRDPRVHQVLVRRDPDLGTERTHEVELVEPGMARHVVERDLVGK